MAQSIRDVMTSSPCTIDADKSVAYAAKMMLEEDVGLAPIVEGDKLVGMLTDRDIAVRVASEGRDPDQVKVIDVASKKLVTIDPEQDLDEALRIMAQHQVRRLPVVEEDGRLIGVVAQADIAREGDDATTGQLVQEISDSGGQMSSMEEQQFVSSFGEPQVEEKPEAVEEEEVSRVQAASARPRRRSTRKRTTTARKKASGGRKKSSGGRKKKAATSRKRSTAKRSTAKRKTTSRKRSTAKRGTTKRKTAARKRSTTKKRSTAKRGTAKRKTASRKRSTAKRGTAKRKTATRKRSTAKRTTAKRSTAKRSTAKRRTTRRRTSR